MLQSEARDVVVSRWDIEMARCSNTFSGFRHVRVEPLDTMQLVAPSIPADLDIPFKCHSLQPALSFLMFAQAR